MIHERIQRLKPDFTQPIEPDYKLIRQKLPGLCFHMAIFITMGTPPRQVVVDLFARESDAVNVLNARYAVNLDGELDFLPKNIKYEHLDGRFHLHGQTDGAKHKFLIFG